MPSQIFLDLEDTVVEPIDNGWPQTSLMGNEQLNAVAKIIHGQGDGSATIFSFAIATVFDKKAFNGFVKARLEAAMNVKLGESLTHQDMLLASNLKGEGNFIPQLSSVIKLGKRTLFINMCQLLDGDSFILIDDTTLDEILEVNGKTIRFINATKL